MKKEKLTNCQYAIQRLSAVYDSLETVCEMREKFHSGKTAKLCLCLDGEELWENDFNANSNGIAVDEFLNQYEKNACYEIIGTAEMLQNLAKEAARGEI